MKYNYMQYGGERKRNRTKEKETDYVIDITKTSDDILYYNPIIYKVDNTTNIFDTKIDPVYSTDSAQPRLDLGFHFYNYSTKDKMEIVETLPTKRKFYYIVNKFEHFVEGSPEASIITQVNKRLEDEGLIGVLSRGFFKLWEMIITFDLIPLDTNDFVSAHLAEGPGAFLQATMYYREMFINKKYTTKNDKYYAITLHDDEEFKKHVPELESKFIDKYSKEKPQRLFIHKTYPTKDLKGGSRGDNGDLTKVKTILNFGGSLGTSKAHLITADGGMNWSDENKQEQESLKLIFGEISTSLLIQANEGHLVIKLFESFTSIVSKLIVILKHFYKEVFVAKPLLSRESSSEKNIICKFFKEHSSNQSKIESLLKTLKNSKDLQIFDIFPSYTFDNKFISMMLAMNKEISNRQIEAINKMVLFINKKDYYGTDYRKFKESQINTSEYWVKMYFAKQLETNEKIIKSGVDLVLTKSKQRVEEYSFS